MRSSKNAMSELMVWRGEGRMAKESGKGAEREDGAVGR